ARRPNPERRVARQGIARSAIMNGPEGAPRAYPDVPRGLPLNCLPLSLHRPANRSIEPEPLRHVIDEYKHREQTITCVCGWHGSCATNSTGGSDWTPHLNQFRTKRK